MNLPWPYTQIQTMGYATKDTTNPIKLARLLNVKKCIGAWVPSNPRKPPIRNRENRA